MHCWKSVNINEASNGLSVIFETVSICEFRGLKGHIHAFYFGVGGGWLGAHPLSRSGTILWENLGSSLNMHAHLLVRSDFQIGCCLLKGCVSKRLRRLLYRMVQVYQHWTKPNLSLKLRCPHWRRVLVKSKASVHRWNFKCRMLQHMFSVHVMLVLYPNDIKHNVRRALHWTHARLRKSVNWRRSLKLFWCWCIFWNGSIIEPVYVRASDVSLRVIFGSSDFMWIS